MKALYGNLYNFSPLTFILPRQYADLVRAFYGQDVHVRLYSSVFVFDLFLIAYLDM